VNYLSLKKLGSIGDSFSDIVTEIQEEIEGNKKLSQTMLIGWPGLSMISVKAKAISEKESSHNGNNNNVLFEDKFYVHNNDDKKKISLKQTPQKEEQRLSPIIVTECLSTHQECTQEYSDITNSFRIKCFCNCHCKDSKRQHRQWWQNHHCGRLEREVEEE
jgi:hypothetical protein